MRKGRLLAPLEVPQAKFPPVDVAGLALGMVALHTRSIYAGMVIHIAVAWSMDLLALFHRGELARLWEG